VSSRRITRSAGSGFTCRSNVLEGMRTPAPGSAARAQSMCPSVCRLHHTHRPATLATSRKPYGNRGFGGPSGPTPSLGARTPPRDGHSGSTRANPSFSKANSKALSSRPTSVLSVLWVLWKWSFRPTNVAAGGLSTLILVHEMMWLTLLLRPARQQPGAAHTPVPPFGRPTTLDGPSVRGLCADRPS
jgi:hypothetical protein